MLKQYFNMSEIYVNNQRIDLKNNNALKVDLETFAQALENSPEFGPKLRKTAQNQINKAIKCKASEKQLSPSDLIKIKNAKSFQDLPKPAQDIALEHMKWFHGPGNKGILWETTEGLKELHSSYRDATRGNKSRSKAGLGTPDLTTDRAFGTIVGFNISDAKTPASEIDLKNQKASLIINFKIAEMPWMFNVASMPELEPLIGMAPTIETRHDIRSFKQGGVQAQIKLRL